MVHRDLHFPPPPFPPEQLYFYFYQLSMSIMFSNTHPSVCFLPREFQNEEVERETTLQRKNSMVKKYNTCNGLEDLRACGPYIPMKIMFLLRTQNFGDLAPSLTKLGGGGKSNSFFLFSHMNCV